ncbi:MAG: NADH-quinone oxidoreductase subunit C [Methanomicrobiales archaeon]|nr:NADH-quinone oxidoreductase subunit C [Methanomicrobiales archaeon]
MSRTPMSAADVAEVFSTAFGDGIESIDVKEWAEGSRKVKNHAIWIRLRRDLLKEAVRRLVEIDYPHLGVVSGVDMGEYIDLQYHLAIFFGIPDAEIMVTLTVALPKGDLAVPTISDIIPGAVYTEREKQEMLGITVTGIPDTRGLFLPADFPKGVYPWRKDETGIRDDMVRELWTVGRPEGRPAPPVKPKEKKKKEEDAAAAAAPAAPQQPAGAPEPEAAPSETEVTKDE